METTTYYTNLFQQIGNPSNRQKRFLGAIGIGLGLVDLLLTGVSYGSVKHHMNKDEDKLPSFIETQHAFDENILNVDKDIVHNLMQLENDLNSALKRVHSQIVDSSWALLAAELKMRWKKA